MDEALMKLRGQVIETSNDFLNAQRVYLDASHPYSRKSNTHLKKAVEGYFEAAGPYGSALGDLFEYLSTKAEQSEAAAAEINRTQRLINVLAYEKALALKLIEHFMELIDREAAEHGGDTDEQRKDRSG